MHHIAWILCLCMSIQISYGQVLTIRDSITEEPLAGVLISSPGRSDQLFTNEKGQCDIGSLRGQQEILVEHLGYLSRTVRPDELASSSVSLYLSPDPLTLGEVIVSVNRWQERKRETPNHIVSITPATRALLQPQTAADMLGVTGEVFIQKSQLGGGSPMIRGFATNRLLMTVDGVRMNTAIFRSGNIQNVISLDPFAIGRTEIAFGPGSVIYGSDAIGGVMNFYTQEARTSADGRLLTGGSVTGRYSTANNEKTIHADLGLGGRKWGSLTSFTFSDYGNLRMGSQGPDDYLRPEYATRIDGRDTILANPDPLVQVPSGYRQYNFMQKLSYRPSDATEWSYGFHYSNTSDYSRYDRLLRYRGSRLRSAEWNYGPQTWMMHHVQWQHTANNRFYDRIKAHAAYQYFAESRLDRDFNSPTRFVRSEQVDAVSLNLDLEKYMGSMHKLQYGAEYVYNQVGSTGEDINIVSGESVAAASRYPDGATWQSMALYATYKWKPVQQWVFSAGVRYNHLLMAAVLDTTFLKLPYTEANLNTGALTGSLGLVYLPSDKFQWRLNLSNAFRAPNVDDVGKLFDSSPGFVMVPNPDPRPERAYNAETGFAWRANRFLSFDVSLFATYLDDALVRRNATINGRDSLLYNGEMSRIQTIQNAAFAFVYGIQGGVDLTLTRHLTLGTRMSYQRGREELDNGTQAPLRHAAPFFGNVRLTYNRAAWTAQVYTEFNSGVAADELAPEEVGKDYLYAADAEGRPYVPAWYTLNAKVQYQVLSFLSVTAGVENILDKRYRPYSSGISAAGRNFIVALRCTF